MVTLVDGREVSAWSEEFRNECEARYVLRMATLNQRRAYLSSVQRHRGAEAVKRLKSTIFDLFHGVYKSK